MKFAIRHEASGIEVMSEVTRRTFIKQTGTAVAGMATIALAPSAARSEETKPGRVDHRAISLNGVHAYSLEHSIAAGGVLELCISASVPYRLSICRGGWTLDKPSGDEVVASWPESPTNPQPIHPGSYLLAEPRIDAPLSGLTLECWLRPCDLTRRQGIVGQWEDRGWSGFGLAIADQGRIEFFLGNGGTSSAAVNLSGPESLHRDAWQHVVGTWDGAIKRLYIDGKIVATWDAKGELQLGGAPLRIGATTVDGAADLFFDGDLAMPVIYGKALSAEEVSNRFAQRGMVAAKCADVLGCWPLDEERGESVHDTSSHQRHATIVNHGTWMIGGPKFSGDAPRFGNYDPKGDATRGHGIRLASDDLYDCGWQVTQRWDIPKDARPGIYFARINYDWQGAPRVYHVTFIVRRGADSAPAPILVIAATTTWRAYGGTPFADTPPELLQVWDTGGLTTETYGLPAYCLYRQHAAGQGTYQVGWRIPWPSAGPYVLYSGVTKYSHLMRADRFSLKWLEQQGYDYDIVSNVDVHRDPSLLNDYKVCAIVGHNEYWSEPMYCGIAEYLKRGGNLMVLSGNTMGWRVSFSDDCQVMECRKVDAGGYQVPPGRRGEIWHSQDGQRGGAMRECGIPGYRLIGLDIIGYNYPSNPKNFGPYIVEQDEHFLFTSPEATGLKNGDSFARGAGGQMPMANGHEMDVRPSTFAALQEQPSPPGAELPEDPPGIVRIAHGVMAWKEGGTATDYFFRQIRPATKGLR
jgi:N,N-dimethylformamidase